MHKHESRISVVGKAKKIGVKSGLLVENLKMKSGLQNKDVSGCGI